MVEDLDRAYAALADPTRRALLVALRDGPARITDLATPLPISFAAVARHVTVLESAGLVVRQVRGREHWLTVRPAGLQTAEDWIAEQTSFWSARVDALAARLANRHRQ
jgi:DNA-binding transcriptional ArsR family regulator